jgi:predicted GNAT family acetyltransferase
MTQNDFVDALNGVMINMRVGDVRHIDRTQISGWETGRRNPDKLIQAAIKKMLKNKKKTLQNKNR